MTHMDDQVAKHIKAILRQIAQKAPDKKECPCERNPLHQIVRTLRKPAYAWDLLPSIRSHWKDQGSKT
jgi:hypothetical protein